MALLGWKKRDLLNAESTGNQARAEEGHVGNRHLPQAGMVVGKDLELGVEVEVQKDEASKGRRGVAAGHTLQAVIDLLAIAGADVRGEVDVLETTDAVRGSPDKSRVGLAHVEEVRAQTTNEPLDEDLEDGGRDQAVENTEAGVVEIPKGANADLHDQEDEHGDEGGEKRGRPDGNDFLAERVGKLGVYDLAVGEGDGEGAGGGRRGEVDLGGGQWEWGGGELGEVLVNLHPVRWLRG